MATYETIIRNYTIFTQNTYGGKSTITNTNGNQKIVGQVTNTDNAKLSLYNSGETNTFYVDASEGLVSVVPIQITNTVNYDDGDRRLGLSKDSEGGRIDIFNDVGSTRIELDVFGDDGYIHIKDSSNVTTSIFGSSVYGGDWTLYNAAGSAHLEAEVTVSDNTMISLYNASEAHVLNLHSSVGIQTDNLAIGVYSAINGTLLGGFNASGEVVLQNGTRIMEYTSSHTDVTGRVSGSNFGTLIEARDSGHLVIGLQGNDDADSFSIISSSNAGTGLGTYDERCFYVNRNSVVSIANLYVEDAHYQYFRNVLDENKMILGMSSDHGIIQMYNASDVETIRLWANTGIWVKNEYIQIHDSGGDINVDLNLDANGGRVVVKSTEALDRIILDCDNADGNNGVIEVKDTSNTVTTTIAGNTGIRARNFRMDEITFTPSAATSAVKIWAEDNGSGKTRLMARFQTGASQQIAIEP